MSMNNDNAIKKLTYIIGKSIVISISEKYNLNADEIMAFLEIDNMNVEVEIKDKNNEEKPKKEKKEKKEKKDDEAKTKVRNIILPFCGKIINDNCYGVRLNHCLYTQCTNKHNKIDTEDETLMLCKTCEDSKNKTSNGVPTYGYITTRMEKGEKYRDPKGKSPINYGNLMEKLKITRIEAEREAESQGLTIPEMQFEVKKTTRGRPKKDTSAVDSSDDENKEEKKEKKEKKAEKEKKEKKEKVDKPQTEKKARGRPKKEKQEVIATTIDEKIEKLVKEVNNPTKKEEKKEKKEEKKEVKKEEKKEVKKHVEEEEEEEENDYEEDDDESDGETLEVKKFEHKGTIYLKASDNKLYDFVTHDEIGIWDEKNNQVKIIK